MKLAIMQPYFFPYIGYFQLINAVDEFIIYDNLQYTKKGWINRNRILVNGKAKYITLPLKKDSDFLDIRKRYVANTYVEDIKKLTNRIREAYRKAPHFEEVISLFTTCFTVPEKNLFWHLLQSLIRIAQFLDITTPVFPASSINIDHNLKAEEKVIKICQARNASEYINPSGGTGLYARSNFEARGIDLHFMKKTDITYKQFDNKFIPNLSIIDVLMFNPKEKVKEYLNEGKPF